MTPADDFDCCSVFHEDILSTKRYFCDVEGCNKSYSNRQNKYRHKLQDHPEIMSAKCTSKFADSEAASVRQREATVYRERELLIENFSSYYEQFGEEQASIAMKNNKKLTEHLFQFRNVIEADISERLSDAKESQSIVERQLTDFKKTIPVDSSDEIAAFRAVINLAKKATPETIGHLKQFAKVITSLTSHIADYSETVNPKYKHARALKNVLDELITEAMDEMEFAEQPTTPNQRKRKAVELNAAAGGAPALNIHPVPALRTDGGSGFRPFLNIFLGSADEEAALLEPVDDDLDR